jgi:hypothetical protein
MRLEILVDGRPALTARMAVDRYATRYRLTERGVRSAVARSGVAPIDPPPLSPRIPLYDQAELDAALANRPGKAWRSRSDGSAASPT